MSTKSTLPVRLSVQTILPPDWESSKSFRAVVEGLRDLGLWGVELNVADLEDPRTTDILRVEEYLARYGLMFAMFASGLTAKTLGVALSSVVEEERKHAVVEAKRMINWTAAGNRPVGHDDPTGIIIGFLKGGVSADPAVARRSLVTSLTELVPHADEKGVPLILEATNRYESSVANSLSDTAAILDEVIDGAGGERPLPEGALQLLPDTFHMNIEEADMEGALRSSARYFSSLHLSDNNRFFPGFGAIDFERVFAIVDRIHYTGRFAIEGNIKQDLLTDLRESVRYLSPFMENRSS